MPPFGCGSALGVPSGAVKAIPASLDHIVLGTPRLADTLAEFVRRTGVTPAPGGVHVGLGTRNYLVGLGGGAYLEILGPDPEQGEYAGVRAFGVDQLVSSRVLTWAIGVDDLDAAVVAARTRGYDPGDVRSMSRRHPDGTLLSWRLTDSSPVHSGLVPFLIDWGSTTHPTATPDLPVTPLLSFSATAPSPAVIRPLLSALNTELQLTEGLLAMSFTLDTPNGVVTFS